MKTQNRMIGLVTSVILSLAMIVGIFPSALAAENDPLILTVKVRMQSEDPADTLPESVTVRLLADGVEIASNQATDDNSHQVAFDVPLPEKAAPDYSIKIDPIEGYTEDMSQHIDPILNFICPVGGDWTKYEPCNELMIPTDRLSHEVIGAKMTKHGPMIIWTPEPMTSAEEQMIVNSIMKNPGVGNPSSVIFVVGNTVTEYGLTINADEGKVLMDRPSDWSLLYGGEYTKSGAEVLNGQIVLNPIKKAEEDPPIVDDPTEDDPKKDESDDPVIDEPTQDPDDDNDQPDIDAPSEDDPKEDESDDLAIDEPTQDPDDDNDQPVIDVPTENDPPLDGPDDPTVDTPEQIPDVEPNQPEVDVPPIEEPDDPTVDVPEQHPNDEVKSPIKDVEPQNEVVIGNTSTSEKPAKNIPNTGTATDAGVIAAASVLIMAAAGLSIAFSEKKKNR